MHETDSALRQYVRTLRRQAWIVILVPILAVGAMVAVVKTQDPVYRASMTLVVGNQPRGQATPSLGDFSLTRTMTALLESEAISRPIISRLNLDMTTAEFKERLKVDVLPETPVLDVSYDSTNPELARSVITEVANRYPRLIDAKLGARIPGQPRAQGSFDLVVRLYDEPHVQADTVGGQVGTSVIFAAVAGLALGLLLAVAREALDSRLRERKDAEDWFAAPVVGTLPKGMDGRPPPGVGSDRAPPGGYDRRTASLDLLRARLQFAHAGMQGPTILVADAGPEMGKSTVAATLGAALALGGKHVICVDTDLRRPRLHRSLGLQQEGIGLLEVLTGHATIDEALRNVELNLPEQAETNGGTPPEPTGRLEAIIGSADRTSPGERLTTEDVTFLIEELNRRADFVVLDAPPLVVADAYPLAVQSDNVLIVARHGRATKDQAEAVRATLRELGVEKVGVVVTDSPAVTA